MPSFDKIPLKILKNMKCYPWFKDYIGTIVGTPIQVVMLTDKAMPYRFGKKKKYMQNMS